MGVLSRLRGGKEKKIQFRRDMTIAETAGEATRPDNPTDDYLDQQRKVAYMTHDPILERVLIENEDLQSFIGDLSPSNTVIKRDKHQLELAHQRWDNRCLETKMTMDPRVYRVNGCGVVNGIRNYGHAKIDGTADGWVGRLCTEQTKITRHEFGEKVK